MYRWAVQGNSRASRDLSAIIRAVGPAAFPPGLFTVDGIECFIGPRRIADAVKDEELRFRCEVDCICNPCAFEIVFRLASYVTWITAVGFECQGIIHIAT